MTKKDSTLGLIVAGIMIAGIYMLVGKGTPSLTPTKIQEAPKQTPEPIGGTKFVEAIKDFNFQDYLIQEHGFEQGSLAVGTQFVAGKLFEEAQAGRTPTQVVAESRKTASAPLMNGVAGSRFLAAIR